ncbi:LytTR family DNA-binding domain-containing protein [Ruminococcaceae bacterium OttesenSCG-928-D13]|nr:LytTR family DNA-binding domain-containing protein [Ruminococcaceae bacterium OttesenSCG-928-D13]
MRIAVCDDNARDRDLLADMCRRFAQEQNTDLIPETFESGAALLERGVVNSYAIVLLDIFMGADNGVETARALRRRNFRGALIFVTSSPEFYPEGYEVGAIHYLVKPVVYGDFCEAIQRALRYCGMRPEPATLPLVVDRQRLEIPLDTIRYIEVYNHTVYVYTQNQRLQTSTSLNSLKARLDDGRFMQCHRSYIVNMDYINYIDESGDAKIVMDSKEIIPVSRRERSNIKHDYIKYVCGDGSLNR